ncbi:unnamed protein product, partial [Ascophyllum nodosum]
DGLGCLIKGPWSVKVFDFIARASARLIISTTSLMFLTMCHGTWNYLSEVEIFRPFLYRWRNDNRWLHTVGGWTMGIWIVVHVWSLMLPWLADGYKNVKVGGDLEWPLQVPLPGGNIDAQNRLARWGLDDIWRIFWMTLVFGALMPLSRSAWALKKNYSLAMWLHMALGAGVFFDSWRRRTHPHVWFLNTPVVLWYLADKLWCSTRGRRGDLMSHPFTTCSSHDVLLPAADNSVDNSAETFNILPTIEPPIKTDVSWPGHRFSLKPSFSRLLSGHQVDGSIPRSLLSPHALGCGKHEFDPYFQDDQSRAEDDLLVGVDTMSTRDGDEIISIWHAAYPLGIHSKTIARMHLADITPPYVPSVKRGDGSDPAALVPESGESKQQKAKRKNMIIKRLPTLEFQEFRKNEVDAGRLKNLTGGGEWDKMAIIKIHRRSAPKVRKYTCMGFTHMMSSYRHTETAHMADLETTENGGVPLRTYGPYRSEYGRLTEFPNLPPLLIIATGAGAALALDFIGYVRANKLVPARSVSICYSSASLALLQFVTNTLLAARTPGIHIKTALTRHDDLELFNTTAERKDDLAIGRLNVMSIMDATSADTEVYFCGGGAMNRLLQTCCAKRSMTYVGSSVQ